MNLKVLAQAFFVCVSIAMSSYAAFAQDGLVGEENVSDSAETYTVLLDVLGTIQIVTYAKVGDEAMVGGDISLGPHKLVQAQSLANTIELLNNTGQSSSGRVRALIEQLALALEDEPDLRAAVGAKTSLWPNGKIPYLITGTIKDPALKTKIETAIAHWNDKSDIELVPAGPTMKVVLRFEDAEGDGYNCYAHVGYTQGSGSYVRLNPACTLGSTIHEIGHALGLMHEHSRPDRDDFLAVRDEVADSPNYRILGPTKFRTGYDLCSIMHYSPRQVATADDPDWFALTERGAEAFKACESGLPPECRQVGQRCTLSSADRDAINSLYPK